VVLAERCRLETAPKKSSSKSVTPRTNSSRTRDRSWAIGLLRSRLCVPTVNCSARRSRLRWTISQVCVCVHCIFFDVGVVMCLRCVSIGSDSHFHVSSTPCTCRQPSTPSYPCRWRVHLRHELVLSSSSSIHVLFYLRVTPQDHTDRFHIRLLTTYASL
jgi:hypothetical protein